MPTDVVMPQMGESITEGTLTKWLKKVGDTVQRDEPLFEISTDKVDAEIPSPAAGTLQEIKIAEGATVQINTVVAVIGDGVGAAAAPESAAAPADDSVTPAAIDSPATDDEPAQRCGCWFGCGTEVPMPQMGESITEGTLTKWLKKVGETVERDEPLFEISTDKVDAEIPSPVAGTLTEIKVQEGSTVAINTIVAVIGREALAGPNWRRRGRLLRNRLRRLRLLPRRLRLLLRSKLLLRRRASGCGRRRWCARLPRTTMSI